MRYAFTVAVDTDDPRHAVRVMSERTGYDEDYGFDYQIDWSIPLGDQYDELVEACNVFYEEV